MNLRPYQGRGFKDIFTSWQYHDLLMFVLATGGGKTVTFMEVIKRVLAHGKRAIMVAHRDELIQQSWKTLYKNKIYAGVIMGQGPITISMGDGTTLQAPLNYSLPCQVSSIQTLMRRKSLPAADYVIIDEGHHVQPNNGYMRVIREFYPNAKILIVTATPYRLSGDGFTDLLPGKKTHLIVNATLKDLTNDGWLVPIRYFLCGVPDLTGVGISKGDYVQEEAKKAMEMAPIVESYHEHVPGKTGITYAVNVQHSIELCSRYIYEGVPAEHVDANTHNDKRAQIMADVRTGLVKVVCNVGILTEGTDFPNLDFVQLAAPTKSLSKYLQEVGRVTRALEGIVDMYDTADERKAAIAQSSKPYGVVLDNAGLFLTHKGGPYDHNDWAGHFNGDYKKQKRSPGVQVNEDMEMLVFVVEDEKGNVRRMRKPEEIEGMKLIEVTKERHEKIINIIAVKEFDRYYATMRNSSKVKKPGYIAFKKFMEHCVKNRILIIPEMWDYLHKKLIQEHHDRWAKVEEWNAAHPGIQTVDNIEHAKAQHFSVAVSRKWFQEQKDTYTTENIDELARYLAGKKQTA